MTTLADKVTLARIAITPFAVAAYLVTPNPATALYAAAILCGLAEITDYLDGKVARARGEVSDFGKLADPFCDVFYRMAMLLTAVLPVSGIGLAISEPSNGLWETPTFAYIDDAGQLAIGSGVFPFIPVLIMVLREVVAGALRAMCATKGLILAARMSGKIKAWFQGLTLISSLALAAIFTQHPDQVRIYALVMAWLCAAFSAFSMIEYIWVNRGALAQLTQRQPRRG